jgi:peptide/nickel transport system substrate-binding protein
MMTIRTDKTLLKAAAIGALAMAAALGAAPAAHAQQSVLRIGLQEDPDMLDPHRARTFVGRIVFKGLCDKLFDASPDLQLVPRLATEWSFSADGMTATIKLRPNVKFHDGSAFTADDVVFSVERALHPLSSTKSSVQGVSAAKRVDDLTVDLVMSEPNPVLLLHL